MNKSITIALGSAILISSANAFSYSNNFESPVGGEWSTTGTSSFNGTNVLGRISNGTAVLTLTGLTVGQSVSVDFDFYAFDSWDGNSGSFGPDRFSVDLNGTALLDSSFSNVNGINQDYPSAFGTGNFALQTGAFDKDLSHGGTLPDGYYGNSLYKFSGLTAIATSSTLVLTFSDHNTLQGVGDESWGIDNVNVNSAVPEPASMAVLGLGAASLLRKRRKK